MENVIMKLCNMKSLHWKVVILCCNAKGKFGMMFISNVHIKIIYENNIFIAKCWHLGFFT